MVVDALRWRERKFTEKLLHWLNSCTVELKHGDQDALNACLVGEWIELHPRFNWSQNAWRIFSRPGTLPPEWKSREKLILEAWAKPAIVHYVGRKPWQSDYYDYAEFNGCTLSWWREARLLKLTDFYVHSRIKIYDWFIRYICNKNNLTAWLYWGLRRRILQMYRSRSG